MTKEDVIEMQGEITENLPNATFRVRLGNDISFFEASQSGCVRTMFVSSLVTR